MSKHYRLKVDIIDVTIFVKILERVDYVPPSLALTQTAIESGWGSSLFSKQGNNLFGKWCLKKAAVWCRPRGTQKKRMKSVSLIP